MLELFIKSLLSAGILFVRASIRLYYMLIVVIVGYLVVADVLYLLGVKV